MRARGWSDVVLVLSGNLGMNPNLTLIAIGERHLLNKRCTTMHSSIGESIGARGDIHTILRRVATF